MDDPTQNLSVGPDGTINFNGFYGDYDVTINGHTYNLSLLKGTTHYSLVVAPGDYNGDHVVDAADYVIWRSTVGSATDLRADGNGDRVIDDNDFGIWRSTYGAVYASGAGLSAAVPEPPIVATILFGAARRAFSCIGGGNLDDAIERRFRPKLAVKKQRIINSPANRPIVKPRVAVVDAPKRYAIDFVGMLDEDAKDFAVASGQLLLHVFGQPVGVRVKFFAKFLVSSNVGPACCSHWAARIYPAL